MMIRTYTLVFIIALMSCESPDKRAMRDIQSVLEGQARAWNNGNIEGYMTGYWMSDSLIFTGKKYVSYGWQSALDRYKEGYPDKSAMGNLTFSEVDTRLTSEHSAYSVGIWTLHRTADTLSGRFTLVWKKVNGSWFIELDHSS